MRLSLRPAVRRATVAVVSAVLVLGVAAPAAAVEVSAGRFVLQVDDDLPDDLLVDVTAAADDLTAVVGPGPTIDATVGWDPAMAALGMSRPSVLVGRDGQCLPAALYEQVYGTDHRPGDPDAVEVELAVRGDAGFWRSHPPVPDDGIHTSLLYRTVLHELLHGLGFSSTVQIDGDDQVTFLRCGDLTGGWLTPYDRLLATPDGTSLADLADADPAAARAAVEDEIVWSGSAADAGTVELYTPSTFTPGSSLSHLATTAPNETLMNPSNTDNRPRSVGTVAARMLADLGWNVAAPPVGTVEQVAFSATDGQVDVSWSDLETATVGFDAKVTVDGGPADLRPLAGPATTVDAGPGQTVAVAVAAVNEVGTGAWSVWHTFTVPDSSDGANDDGDASDGTGDASDGTQDASDGTSGDEPASVTRLSGPSRYATAATIATETFASADVVYLATGRDFPDALAGAALAAADGGPVLLTDPDRLPDATATALHDLAPDRVVVLGGDAAVSDRVARLAAAAADGAALSRLSGPSRFATAAAVSRALHPDGHSDVVYLATGRDFPDALAGTVAAIRDDAPVLLTDPDRLPDATADELARLTPARIVVLGGPAAVSDDTASAAADAAGGATVDRLSGPDRFTTAAAVSQATFTETTDVFVATGTAFPDALAGAVLAARSGPLLLVTRDTLPAATAADLDRLGARRATVFGGTSAVSRDVARAILARLG